MSGKYSGLRKKTQGVAPFAYYVYCALHNLNLELKDAIEAVTETRKFYDTIESVYNFVGHSIVRWQKLPRQFLNKRAKKTKPYFDEISKGITLSDPEKRVCVTVFLPMTNIRRFLAN